MTSLVKMIPEHDTFQEAFDRRMPLELKQMVFEWAIKDNDNSDANEASNDIQIRLADNDPQSLKPSAVDFLAILKNSYSATVYNEAVEYLTESLFRWVFISDSVPHRFVFAVFRKQVPPEIRECIQYVYLRGLGMASLTKPTRLQEQNGNLICIQMAQWSAYSNYLKSIDTKMHVDTNEIRQAIMQDIRGGLTLLPYVLPSINKIDIDLDIYDWVAQIHDSWFPLSQMLGFLRGSPKSTLLSFWTAMVPFKTLKNISEVDIRVVWNPQLEQSGSTPDTLDDEQREVIQNAYIKVLRGLLPAKSITGHSK
jgi:hypothetical protein